MPLNISVPETTELRPRILVFGVGGAGGNAVNNMIESQLEGVDFAVANTDAQALTRSKTERRVQMGAAITEGLGAGARPEIGSQSAEDSLPEIMEHLAGAHMVFITAGMGGGTGTGAAPVIARAAREQGILTVGVVTKPFHFEGTRRMRIADSGIEQLQEHVDTLIVIPNQNLFRIATEKTTFAEAFQMADDVLHSGVRGITDLMVMPGLINLDFADVRAVMNEMGKAMMGTGEASGEKRATEAAHAAIANPLLDDVSLDGATGVLINITGGYDMTLYEVDEAANEIRNQVDPDANIIVGSTFDEALDGTMRVSVVATGIDAERQQAMDPRRAQQRTAAPAVDPHAGILPWKREGAGERPGAAAAPRNGPLVARLQPEKAEYKPAPQAQRELEPEINSMPDPVSEEIEHDPYMEADERPQVIRDQERIAAEADRIQREPAPRIEDEAPAEEMEEERKPSFSLFGRRKRPMAPVPKTAPRRTDRMEDEVRETRPATGDLFGGDGEDTDLEIPAFLRRQAN
ncbi:cell division protein FtsZ [Hyphobacterium sp. HN65]|uniref:Cell division protein FtsZ n=1 Tax=Hyphobacterium lacteum TaxID=3116575 RepID=A0ABU7LQW8_9PROT|nr:cell division protein FtsZ [Hyphobacterium sp. HN65]MEE2526315.1 cell division protein FtsZ [Hyphobacterium sp. HN65]